MELQLSDAHSALVYQPFSIKDPSQIFRGKSFPQGSLRDASRLRAASIGACLKKFSVSENAEQPSQEPKKSQKLGKAPPSP
jgi:hypothetical protein